MKVLFATDGSAEAGAAAALLESAAHRDGVEIVALSVAALASTSFRLPPGYLREAVAEDMRHAGETAAAATERLARSGFPARPQTGKGHPGECIVEAVRRGGVDLTVMGYGTHRWLGSRLLGSTGSFVLDESPTSVLLAHAAPAAPDHCRVMVATDGSGVALAAVSVIARLLDPERCSVEVVSATPLPGSWSAAADSGLTHPYVAPSLTPERYRDLAAAERDRTEAVAREAADRLAEAGFATEIHMTYGPVKASLLTEMSEGHFDLAVAGSRGLGPFRRAVMGSVSEALVNHAPATLVGRTPVVATD